MGFGTLHFGRWDPVLFFQEPATFVTRIDSTLNIVTGGFSETLVHIHRTPRRHTPENGNMNNNDTVQVRFNLDNSDPMPLCSARNDSC